MPQRQLPIFPAGVTEINHSIAVQKQDGQVWYVHGHLPVFHHEEEDIGSFRMFTSQMIVNGTTEFVGTDREAARRAISEAAKSSTGRVTIEIAKAIGEKTGSEQMVVRLSALLDLALKNTRKKCMPFSVCF